MKITDQILNRYLEIQEEMKDLGNELRVIKDSIIASNGAKTRGHTALLKTMTREYVAGRPEFEAKFPGWLEKNDLLRVTEYEQVIVVKNRKAA